MVAVLRRLLLLSSLSVYPSSLSLSFLLFCALQLSDSVLLARVDYNSQTLLVLLGAAVTFEAVGNKLMHRMLKCKELPLRQRLFHCQLPVMYGRQMKFQSCLLYTSPSPRDMLRSRMPSSA